MTNYKTFTIICLLGMSLTAHAQVELDSAGREAGYVQTIVERAQKIVAPLQLTDARTATYVTHIVANRYFWLNDIYQQHAADKTKLQSELYLHHFEFAAHLSRYLSDHQVEQVKDGMTYGVVPKTYQAHLEMIPSLKDDEKRQILCWLKEARELAIDAGDSKSKHAWFGKYKGRINNWLAQRGYNLKAEREAWYQRIGQARKK